MGALYSTGVGVTFLFRCLLSFRWLSFLLVMKILVLWYITYSPVSGLTSVAFWSFYVTQNPFSFAFSLIWAKTYCMITLSPLWIMSEPSAEKDSNLSVKLGSSKFFKSMLTVFWIHLETSESLLITVDFSSNLWVCFFSSLGTLSGLDLLPLRVGFTGGYFTSSLISVDTSF